jgi:hypothetical protein
MSMVTVIKSSMVTPTVTGSRVIILTLTTTVMSPHMGIPTLTANPAIILTAMVAHCSIKRLRGTSR